MEKPTTSFRSLQIYQESKALGVKIHKMSLTLPKFELYEEGSQVRRSAKAVTASIVEGYARRRYKREYVKYLVYALGECDETIVHLDYLFETGSLVDRVLYEQLTEGYVTLSRKINKFLQWVEENVT